MGDGTSSGLLSVDGMGSPWTGSFVTLASMEIYGDRMELVFGVPVAVVGIAVLSEYWPITGSTPGAPVPIVSSVEVSGVRIKLYYSEGRDGASYSLVIPVVGVQDLAANPFMGPFTQAFTGVGIDPFCVLAAAEDALHAHVIFSEPVNEEDALIAANYTITGGGGLIVYSVTKVNSTTYRLKTSLQGVGHSYTVSINNIRDSAGNYI